MIEFQYREIAKIMDLVSYELDRIHKMKNKQVTTISAPGQTDDFENDLYSMERSRLDSEVTLLESIKTKYEDALNKVVFRFTQDNPNKTVLEEYKNAQKV